MTDYGKSHTRFQWYQNHRPWVTCGYESLSECRQQQFSTRAEIDGELAQIIYKQMDPDDSAQHENRSTVKEVGIDIVKIVRHRLEEIMCDVL